jgi:hypothetical protein
MSEDKGRYHVASGENKVEAVRKEREKISSAFPPMREESE